MAATNGAAQQQSAMQVQQRSVQPGAIQQAPSGRTPFLPTSIQEGWILAEQLAASTLVPKAYQKQPHNILATIIIAQELEVSPMLAMREIYFINDRPTLYAEFKLALVKRSPICEYFDLVESSATKATFETKRAGARSPTRLTYTIEEARTAGLLGKEPWQKFPANMLRWRVIGWLCDMVYPELVFGLKTREEMEDEVGGEVVSRQTYAPPPQPPAQTYVSPMPTVVQTPPLPLPPPVVQAQPEQPKAEAKPDAPAQDKKGEGGYEANGVTAEDVKNAPAVSMGHAVAVPPDPIEVWYAELRAVDSRAGVDALSKQINTLAPKGHARRDEMGRALSAKRTAIQQGGR